MSFANFNDLVRGLTQPLYEAEAPVTRHDFKSLADRADAAFANLMQTITSPSGDVTRRFGVFPDQTVKPVTRVPDTFGSSDLASEQMSNVPRGPEIPGTLQTSHSGVGLVPTPGGGSAIGTTQKVALGPNGLPFKGAEAEAMKLDSFTIRGQQRSAVDAEIATLQRTAVARLAQHEKEFKALKTQHDPKDPKQHALWRNEQEVKRARGSAPAGTPTAAASGGRMPGKGGASKNKPGGTPEDSASMLTRRKRRTGKNEPTTPDVVEVPLPPQGVSDEESKLF